MLDVGCGTGELLRQIGARYPGAKLAGIDPVAPMLTVARGKLPPGVDLEAGWADGLPWPDASFDVVVSCNVFHYVTNPGPALAEMSRVLAPHGRIVITDWCDDISRAGCAALPALTGAAFHKIYRAGDESLFSAAGYSTGIERYKISWLWGLMTASAVRAAPADRI